MSEIASFYGFTVSMDNAFEGTPNILIDYNEDDIHAHYDLDKNEFTDGNLNASMKRIIREWLDDHVLLLRAMWDERTITSLPDWE